MSCAKLCRLILQHLQVIHHTIAHCVLEKGISKAQRLTEEICKSERITHKTVEKKMTNDILCSES